MSLSLLDKLVLEIQRFQNKSFLKATMAVCALVALAQPSVSLAKRYRVNAVVQQLKDLSVYDPHKAVEIFDDYLFALQENADAARRVLYAKVARFAGQAKPARTLMRVAYAIMTVDGRPAEAEIAEFERICGELGLDPRVAMADLSQKVAA